MICILYVLTSYITSAKSVIGQIIVKLADPPLVTSDLVGLSLILHSGHKHAQAQKVSTELTRLYRGFYSAVLDFPRLNHSF